MVGELGGEQSSIGKSINGGTIRQLSAINIIKHQIFIIVTTIIVIREEWVRKGMK